jgi:hypothetical protein
VSFSVSCRDLSSLYFSWICLCCSKRACIDSWFVFLSFSVFSAFAPVFQLFGAVAKNGSVI